MVTTVMNGNDCFKNGNDYSKWQRPFTKGKIALAPSTEKRDLSFLQCTKLDRKVDLLQVELKNSREQ